MEMSERITESSVTFEESVICYKVFYGNICEMFFFFSNLLRKTVGVRRSF